MSGATISYRFDDVQFRQAITGLTRMGRDTTPLMRAIGVGLTANTRQRFMDAKDPTGKAWAPLLPAYAEIKRGPGILRAAGMRGGLMGSITYAASMDEVSVGTNKIYGAIHQFGGIIRPRNPTGLLVFRLAHGITKAKYVTIPARPYLGFSVEDEDTVMDVTEVTWARALAARRLNGP